MRGLSLLLLVVLSANGANQELLKEGLEDAEASPSKDVVRLESKWVRITKKQFEPTLRDVAYGPYERNKLDFWRAESPSPTPLVFYIHGGGWGGGSKEENKGPSLNLLKHGVT